MKSLIKFSIAFTLIFFITFVMADGRKYSSDGFTKGRFSFAAKLSSIVPIGNYKVRIVVEQTSYRNGFYDYTIYAYVCDSDGDDNIVIPIPQELTVYGTLTLNGQSVPVSIKIPTSGEAVEVWTRIPQLTASTLRVNYILPTYLNGIPVTGDPIVFQ